MSGARTIQFRLVMGKGDERVFGPDDADTVATIAKADATMDLSVVRKVKLFTSVAWLDHRLSAC